MTGLYLGGPARSPGAFAAISFSFVRLWGSIAALPPFSGRTNAGEDGPWYLMGLVRRTFAAGDTKSAMTAFERFCRRCCLLDRSRDDALLLDPLPAKQIFAELSCMYWSSPFRWRRRPAFLCCFASARPATNPLPKSKNIIRMILGTTRAALTTDAFFSFSLGVNRDCLRPTAPRPGESPADVKRWASMVFQSVGYRRTRNEEAALSPLRPRGSLDRGTVEGIAGAAIEPDDLRFARGLRVFSGQCKTWRANLRVPPFRS